MTPEIEMKNLVGQQVVIQIIAGGAFIKEARVLLASATHLWLESKLLGGSTLIIPWTSVAYLSVNDKESDK